MYSSIRRDSKRADWSDILVAELAPQQVQPCKNAGQVEICCNAQRTIERVYYEEHAPSKQPVSSQTTEISVTSEVD